MEAEKLTEAEKVTSTFSGESGKGDIHIFRRGANLVMQ
jgi:hypothetical protein